MEPRALKEVRKPLAGGTLVVIQFPVLRAIRVAARVAKVLSPVVAGLGKGLNLDELVSGKVTNILSGGDLNLSQAVPGALNAIADKLDPEEFADLCEKLLASAYWLNAGATEKLEMIQPGAIEAVCGGSMADLFTALRAALEANDFFGLGAIGRLRGALGASGPKASPESLNQT